MTTAVASPRPSVVSAGRRIASIDIIRGVVMVLMAIDHVRVYSGLPAGGAELGIFFTRWITHFCAPAFVFLAGTSAFLHGRRHSGLSRYLLIRGVLLIVLELTVIRAAWTFNFEFADYQMAGIIWAIGWCMILMAGLVTLPITAVGTIGIVIIAAHNLLDSYAATLIPSLGNDVPGALWRIAYVGFFAGPIRFGDGGPSLIVLYSIVPWIGVMAAGYAFGAVLIAEPEKRRRLCLTTGLAAIVLFIVLRAFNVYGDPQAWTGGTLAFLNTTKYPASLLFLLMTLGPTIAAVALLERAGGPVSRLLSVFGRVPFFFYVLHIPLIHALALIVSKVRLGAVSPWLFANHPMGNPPAPADEVWSLWLLYLVWAVAVVILYVTCRWFAEVKARRRDWWLGYL